MNANAHLWKQILSVFWCLLFGCAEANADSVQDSSRPSGSLKNLFPPRDHGVVEITAIGDIYITGDLCEMINCWEALPRVAIFPLKSTSQLFITAKFSTLPELNSCTNAFVTALDERGAVKTFPVNRKTKPEQVTQVETWCKLVYDWYLRNLWLRHLLISRFQTAYSNATNPAKQDRSPTFLHPMFFQSAQ